MSRKINLENVPEVEAYISLPQAAERMNLSRQQVHKMAASGFFMSLRRIGTYLVVSPMEVDDKKSRT